MKVAVTQPRLICGLLSELEACGTYLVCRLPTVNRSSVATVKLELVKGYRDSLVQLSPVPLELHRIEKIYCEGLLQNKRVAFELVALDKQWFRLPMEIMVADLRRNPRIQFAADQYPAEIRYPSGIALGHALDLNREHIALHLNVVPDELVPGTNVEVIVRSAAADSDIFFHRCTLTSIVGSEGRKKAILSLASARHHADIARPPRHLLNSVSVRYSFRDIADNSLDGHMLLLEASLTGFLAELVNDSGEVTPGMVLQSNEPSARFVVTRREGSTIACRLIMDVRDPLYRSWQDFLERHSNADYQNVLRKSELAALFTESTFLKGKRRSIYGKNPQNHMVHLNGKHPFLSRRFTQMDDGKHLSQHVACARFTDHCWLLQEVASGIYKKDDIASLFDSVLQLTADEAMFLPAHPGFMAVLYDPTVKTNQTYWEALASKPYSMRLYAKHLSLTSLASVAALPCRILDTAQVSIREKEVASGAVSGWLLQLLDYWAKGPSNRVLNRELSELGGGHSAKLSMVVDQLNGAVLALAYRIATYYSGNVTGVLNSVYLFLSSDLPPEKDSAVVAAVRNSTMAFGTDDILVISSTRMACAELTSGKQFAFLILDLADYRKAHR